MWKATVWSLSVLFGVADAAYMPKGHVKVVTSNALALDQAVSKAVVKPPANLRTVEHTKEAGNGYLPGSPLYGMIPNASAPVISTPSSKIPPKVNWLVFAVAVIAGLGCVIFVRSFMGKQMGAKVVAEFVGTYLLVLTIGCNVLSNNSAWAGVSIACVLMVAIYSFGSVSGAHFNPAVSFALFVSHKMNGAGVDLQTMLVYWVAQITAGIVAAFSYTLMLHDQSFDLSPAKFFTGWQAGLCELLYTCMLCFVVLNVAAAKKYSVASERNEFYGLAIGFVIIAGAYGAGKVSGGCFNPAVAIGIDTASHIKGFGWCLPYTLCELVGALLAVGFFRVVRPGDFADRYYYSASSTLSTLTSEFLGTFMLMLTVILNILGNSSSGAFSIAASLLCMIYALGDVSGAHFNPAVTFAIYVSKSDINLTSFATVAQYMAAQIGGALIACCMGLLIYLKNILNIFYPVGSVMIDGKYANIAFGETIFTFLLCFVVLAVAFPTKTQSKTMFGLAIGSCVTVGGFAAGKICRAALNPAVSIALILAGGGVGRSLAYVLFEICGALLAALVFRITHEVKVYDLPKRSPQKFDKFTAY